MTEWRTIPGWSAYEASDEGQIRHGDLIMSLSLAGKGYLYVHLGRKFATGVHRLVCAAFHGPAPTPKHEVAHWDGVRTNNRASNLRWATKVDNFSDQLRHGTRLRGERQNGAKMTAEKVVEIRERCGRGEKQDDVAAAFGICQASVWYIVHRINWKHVP